MIPGCYRATKERVRVEQTQDLPSLARDAATGGLWLAGFRLLTQLLSWAITIWVARILAPEDYGLMSMASLLTGYAAVFSELGLAMALIQRKQITQEQLSSTFWFSMIVAAIFAIITFGLAYPTAWLFNEPRVIPITQSISVLFIIGGVALVPYSILNRTVRFKALGMIQFLAVTVASFSMLVMARSGYGVWTLILGTIILRASNAILVFLAAQWRPDLHFRLVDVRPFLLFGINVAGANSLDYVLHAVINFIIGANLGAQALGYYSFAFQLATAPSDKVLAIVNQVSFPVFSQYQHSLTKTRDFYLKVTKYVSLIASPLFLTGVFFGDEIIAPMLGESWTPMNFFFKTLCLARFAACLSEIHSLIHNSQGRPKWVLYLRLSSAGVLPLVVLAASAYGNDAAALPWVTVYPAICLVWTSVTLKSLGIPAMRYLGSCIGPFLASLVMMTGVYVGRPIFTRIYEVEWGARAILLQEMVAVALLYGVYVRIFERVSLHEIAALLRWPSPSQSRRGKMIGRPGV